MRSSVRSRLAPPNQYVAEIFRCVESRRNFSAQRTFFGNSVTKNGFQRIVIVSGGRYRTLNRIFMRNETLWRATLLWLCSLVFFFALHAKLAVYNGDAPAKVTPSTASKLWVSSQKMESQTLESAGVVLFWIAFTSLFSLYLHREPRVQSVFVTPPPTLFPQRHLRRFLRPPPVQD